MKKILALVFVAALLVPLLGAMSKEVPAQAQPQPTVMVNDVVRSLAGTWTGRGTMKDMKTDQDMPWVDHVVSQTALNNKFLMTEVSSDPDAHGNVSQGKGFMTYNPTDDKYEMYWFDTMGAAGEYEGQKQGNVINFTHQDKNGSQMMLTMTLVNDHEYRMSMRSKMGDQVIPMMNITYTKAAAQIPQPSSQPVKVNVPYGY